MTSVFPSLEYRSSMTVSQVLAIFTIKTAMLVGIMEISMDPLGDTNRTHDLKLELEPCVRKNLLW